MSEGDKRYIVIVGLDPTIHLLTAPWLRWTSGSSPKVTHTGTSSPKVTRAGGAKRGFDNDRCWDVPDYGLKISLKILSKYANGYYNNLQL